MHFPFSNKKYDFSFFNQIHHSPKRKKQKVNNVDIPRRKINEFNNNLVPSTLNNHKNEIHQIDDFHEYNSHKFLQHISDKLTVINKKQNELNQHIKNESFQNITSLDDMLYSDKRSLKAFGVDKQRKQTMKMASTAIDNDKIEYKYNLLNDILNSNSNKQIAQKLQGMYQNKNNLSEK